MNGIIQRVLALFVIVSTPLPYLQTLNIEALNVSIEFDKKAYTFNEFPLLTVTDPEQNSDDKEIDTVSVRFYSSLDPGGILVVMRETEPDSGIFQEKLSFQDPESYRQLQVTVEQGGNLFATYKNLTASAQIVEAPSPISQSGDKSIAIAFDKQVYSINERMTITVVDPAMNFDSFAIDTVELKMRSSSAPQGGGYYSLWPIRETGNSTGIFRETALFVKDNAMCDCGLRVFVKLGDLLYANYKNLTASVRIFDPSSAVLTSSGPDLNMQIGKAGNYVAVLGDNVIIESSINNNRNYDVSFANILLIKDSDDFTVEIITKDIQVHAKGSSQISFSWKPIVAGDYQIEVFSWSDLQNPHVLAPFPNTARVSISDNA